MKKRLAGYGALALIFVSGVGAAVYPVSIPYSQSVVTPYSVKVGNKTVTGSVTTTVSGVATGNVTVPDPPPVTVTVTSPPPPPVTVTVTQPPTTTEPPPPPPVAGSVYLALNGNDANACTQAAPCKSFQRGYEAAEPGASVLVSAGSYPSQIVSNIPSKTAASAPVTFKSYNGPVSVPLLDIGQEQLSLDGAKSVAFEDMELVYTRTWLGSDGVRLERVTGKSFDLLNVANGVVRNSDFGPCFAPDDLPSPCVSRVAPRGGPVLIEGNKIHDMFATDPLVHLDGMMVTGGSAGLTIRNNEFRNNAVTHIRVKNCCGNIPISNVVIEGNTFDRPLNGDGSRRANVIDIDSDIPGLKVRFNSTPDGNDSYISIGPDQTDMEMTANAIGGLPGCIPGVRYSYNVYVPWKEYQFAPCGPTDKKVTSLGFEPGSFTPSALSPLLNAVPASVGCPPVDLKGTPRLGVTCDAGAIERP